MYFYASAMGNLKIFFSISLCIFKHHLVNCARKNFYKETNKKKNRSQMSYQVEGVIGDLGSSGSSFTGQ